MAVINATGNALTGTTGTGNFVGATSPTLVTPNIGVATGTSLNLGASTTITGMIDDDTMATASASLAASSESIVAYIAAQLPSGGKIIQYVTATSSTDDATTSATMSNTSLTAGITPTDAANLLIIIANGSVSFNGGSSSVNSSSQTQIYRTTGTPGIICGPHRIGDINGTAAIDNTYGSVTMIGQETAGDTNLHTYYVQFKRTGSTGTTNFLGSSGGPAIFILLEMDV